MTPQEVVDALVNARLTVTTLDVTFREGLRIEQMTALLQTLDTSIDPREFYELATNPPAELLADYEWLRPAGGREPRGLPLPGHLRGRDRVRRRVDAGARSAEDLIRMLLDQFLADVGEERMDVPASRGMTFYQVVTLASIVEHEAAPTRSGRCIAGVYQNRLDGLRGVPRILNADPTVTYATDTMALEDLPFEDWQEYFFWKVPPSPLADVQVDPVAAGLPDLPGRGAHPEPDLDAEPGLDRGGA